MEKEKDLSTLVFHTDSKKNLFSKKSKKPVFYWLFKFLTILLACSNALSTPFILAPPAVAKTFDLHLLHLFL